MQDSEAFLSHQGYSLLKLLKSVQSDFTGQKTVGESDKDAEVSEIQPDEKARQDQHRWWCSLYQ